MVTKSTVIKENGVSNESFNEHREEVMEMFSQLNIHISGLHAKQDSLKGNVDEISRKLDRLLKEVDEAKRAAAQAYVDSVMNRVNEYNNRARRELPALTDGTEIVDADEVLDITDE